VICNAINDLNPVKRQVVTISGPERFGLSDPLVSKLISELPNVEKCTKYIAKPVQQ